MKNKILEIAQQIPGTMDRLDYAERLYLIAKELPENCRILDIGGLYGASAIVFALTVKDRGGLVYTINPGFTNPKKWPKEYKLLGVRGDIYIFLENITKCGVEGYVFPLAGTSEEVLNRWDGRLFDMIFIDGCHQYEFVKTDCQWLKYAKENAIVAFDDWDDGNLEQSEVEKAGCEYLKKNSEWKRFFVENKQQRVFVFQKGDLNAKSI